MKTITKNTKRVLSLCLALALLLGSMVISNVGVNFTANAAEATTLKWSGDAATDFAKGSGTEADPYIIETPEQLAFLMVHSTNAWNSSSHTSATTGKYYKVAANRVFDMDGKSWNSYTNTYFAGNFDGNGLIVKNLTGSATRMGLFPCVEGGFTIKNVTVKDSIFTATSANGVGGIFGYHNNWVTTASNIENCAVINCTITNTASNTAGLIGGFQAWRAVTITNCYTANNTISAVGTNYGGMLPGASPNSNAALNVNNCISIGNSPYATGGHTPGVATYNNVYTDTANSAYTGTGITTTVSTGADALSAMGLGSAYWMATSSYPVLKGAHKFNTVNNGNGTHTATCTCCDTAVVGLPEDHFYDLDNAEGGKAYCSCGASIAFTSKIWNGTADNNWDGAGTKEDPYIIRTAEQLYAMVQSEGYKTVDGVDIPLYFKVADGIDTFYLNDALNYNTAEKFAGAVGLMTNWSKDLIIASDTTCQDPDCPAKKANNGSADLHYGAYIYTFLGHFDGNGVTIKGLYSETNVANQGTNIYPGTGFFPSMSDNASIANVTFDVSYIKNLAGSAAVVTSSYGTPSNNAYFYSSSARCSYFTTRYCERNNVDLVGASITLSNIAVKNAHIETTFKGTWSDCQNVGGLLAAQFSADSIYISNCLFDARNSIMTVNGSDTPLIGGIIASSTYINKGNSLYNCVTLSNDNIDNIASNYHTQYNISTRCYALGSGSTEHGTIWAEEFSTTGMPLLDWATWDEDTITPNASADGFTYKDYKFYRNNFKNSEYYGGVEYGSYSDGISDGGMFFKFNTLEGSGTEADPYLISDADTLFQVIAAGGMHRGNPQHFKLTNDIDIGGTQWVKYQDQSEDDIRPGANATSTIIYYDYRSFGGVLDGDGYAVTGLYTASSDATAGFIPTLDGGTVKNLHFRGGYVYSSAASAKTGVIAGEVKNGGKIENCSIAETVTEKIDGSNAATNCINFTTNPVEVTADTDAATYYGIVGGAAQLVSRGQKLPYVDIDADGKGDEYTSRDLTALREKLLRNADYKLVMGDASRNGSTDIRDLTFVKRVMVKDEFGAQDGFWSAVKGGSIDIYFTDNDDYDAARKVELFLESQVPGLDVVKYGTSTVTIKGHENDNKTLPNTNAIIINSNDSTADWSIKYNSANAVLNINGKNYTAAYEAAEYFAANSNASTGAFVSDYTGTQDTNKAPVTVNGQTYYYAWADEFNTAVNGSISYDTWLIRDKGGDKEVSTSTGATSTSYAFYDNLKLGSDEMLTMLNEVSGGKLKMHRGVQNYSAWETEFGSKLGSTTYYSNTTTDTGDKVAFDSNDMASSGVLNTKNSMIYNKGYVEFKAKLPNDMYSFPALWLYTTPGYNNRDISISMYGKVLPLNSRYDNNSINFSADKVESYKYEVPTYFFELDVVEILNQGTVRKQTNTTIHKWYNNARVAGSETNAFTIYDLNWDAVRNNTNQFSTVLAAYNGSRYTTSNISLHSGSKTSASAFASSTTEGGASWIYTDSTRVGSNTQTSELIFGYLWEDNVMKVYILDGSTRTQLKTWTLDSTGGLTNGGKTYKTYDNYSGAALGDDQYTHILIDNHMFPYEALSGISAWLSDGDFKSEEVLNDGILELDYVRVYQLDGAKNIVTSDTEAFNTNNRLGK